MQEISSEMHFRDLERSKSTIAFSGKVVFELAVGFESGILQAVVIYVAL